jgi:hypothetical protein
VVRDRTLRRIAASSLVVILALGLAGCAAGPGGRWAAPDAEAAGFFAGLWHGILLVVTLVVSFFTDDVRIYEAHNAGLAYDIGFVLGVLVVWGNGVHVGLGRRRSRRRDREDVGDDVERRIRARIARWLEDEDEWKDLGEKLERRIKDRLRRWLEEDGKQG